MLAQDGIPLPEDLRPLIPSTERLQQGPVALIECFQEIPCNPCADACPRKAITMPSTISSRPCFDEKLCNGCGLCVSRCPGLAIFVVDCSFSPDEALLKLPYEFVPLPVAGEVVETLDRCGDIVGAGRIVRVQNLGNKTTLLSLAVPQGQVMDVRNIRCRKEGTL